MGKKQNKNDTRKSTLAKMLLGRTKIYFTLTANSRSQMVYLPPRVSAGAFGQSNSEKKEGHVKCRNVHITAKPPRIVCLVFCCFVLGILFSHSPDKHSGNEVCLLFPCIPENHTYNNVAHVLWRLLLGSRFQSRCREQHREREKLLAQLQRASEDLGHR